MSMCIIIRELPLPSSVSLLPINNIDTNDLQQCLIGATIIIDTFAMLQTEKLIVESATLPSSFLNQVESEMTYENLITNYTVFYRLP